jgi:hypothetical protein
MKGGIHMEETDTWFGTVNLPVPYFHYVIGFGWENLQLHANFGVGAELGKMEWKESPNIKQLRDIEIEADIPMIAPFAPVFLLDVKFTFDIQFGVSGGSIQAGVNLTMPLGQDRYFMHTNMGGKFSAPYNKDQTDPNFSSKPYITLTPPKGLYVQIFAKADITAGVGISIMDQTFFKLEIEATAGLRIFFNFPVYQLRKSLVLSLFDLLTGSFTGKKPKSIGDMASEFTDSCCMVMEVLYSAPSIKLEINFDIDLYVLTLDFGKYDLTFSLSGLGKINPGCLRIAEVTPNICLNTDESCYADTAAPEGLDLTTCKM